MSFIIFFLGYLALLMAIGYLVNRLMLPVFGQFWRYFVAPGVIVHELAHALGCVVTGAHIHEINFWKPSGGHVLHGPPRFHLIGPVIISFAPMIVMTLGLFLLAPIVAQGITDLPWTQELPKTFGQAFGGYLISLVRTAQHFDWTSFRPWLLIYAMLNVAVTIAPSNIDLKNTLWAFVGLVIASLLSASFLEIRIPLDPFWPPVATSLLLLGLALVVAFVSRLFGLMVKR